MGTLSRTTTGEFEECVTRDGFKIWTDLPYLVKDFREFWRENWEKMDFDRRCNLVAFMARLTALGVCDAALSSCALALFKETFEVQRPLMSEDAVSDGPVPIAELVPACYLWMRYCGHKILTLAFKNHSFEDVDSEDLKPGELARNAGVLPPGLSVDRWIFWRSQFRELCRSEDETICADGKRGFRQMIYTGQEIGVKIPGEAEHRERGRVYLRRERERPDSTGVVSIEDIPMFSDEEGGEK
jgi:hypothetical protein